MAMKQMKSSRKKDKAVYSLQSSLVIDGLSQDNCSNERVFLITVSMTAVILKMILLFTF